MRWLPVAAVVLAVASQAVAQQAVAEEAPFPRNPQIDIDYAAPSNPRFQLRHDRMKQLRTLELLQEFLSPLKLPHKLTVRMAECGGEQTVAYDRDKRVVTICYEYIAAIDANSPAEGIVLFGSGRKLTAQQTVVGAVVHLMLHQTAYGVFDMLEIPLWGRLEDAVDNTAGFLMLEFGEEVAWTTLLGSAWFMAQRGILGTGFFTDTTRPSEAQRFYNFLCLAYGAQEKTYAFLVNNFNLPQGRARYCRQDYLKVRAAFRDVFMVHMDRTLLAQVQKRKWLP